MNEIGIIIRKITIQYDHIKFIIYIKQLNDQYYIKRGNDLASIYEYYKKALICTDEIASKLLYLKTLSQKTESFHDDNGDNIQSNEYFITIKDNIKLFHDDMKRKLHEYETMYNQHTPIRSTFINNYRKHREYSNKVFKITNLTKDNIHLSSLAILRILLLRYVFRIFYRKKDYYDDTQIICLINILEKKPDILDESYILDRLYSDIWLKEMINIDNKDSVIEYIKTFIQSCIFCNDYQHTIEYCPKKHCKIICREGDDCDKCNNSSYSCKLHHCKNCKIHGHNTVDCKYTIYCGFCNKHVNHTTDKCFKNRFCKICHRKGSHKTEDCRFNKNNMRNMVI